MSTLLLVFRPSLSFGLIRVLLGISSALLLAVLTGRPATSSTVAAWGNARYDYTLIPEDLKPVPTMLTAVTAIAAGDSSTVALKSDGTVVEWIGNYDDFGPTTVPGLREVVAIATAYEHNVALKRDGTVFAWGTDFHGETIVPAGLTGVTAIAAGWFHTAALRNDGTVVAWGDERDWAGNYYGLTNIPPGLGNVTAIAAGMYHTVALTSGGSVWAWGGNSSPFTVPAGLSGVTAIAAGGAHTVALKNDGTVVAWGWNDSGQTDVPAGLSGVTAIAAGFAHTVALKSDGTVVAWGANESGQTTVPAGLSEVTAISAGGDQSFAFGPLTVIAQQPITQTVVVGQNARFTITATGAAPLRYQWRKDGVDVTGATRASLELSNVQASHVGNYAVVLTNGYGSVTSSLATLTIIPGDGIPSGKLTNLSVRAATTIGAPTIIVGFVVGGSGGAGTLPVLVRATGPSLENLGLSGALTDPALTLFQDNTVLASNDNWDTAAQVSSVGSSVGAFPLIPGSLDAAFYHSGIAGGTYTAQITGNRGTVGIALAEIYDAAPSSAPGTMRVLNLSARSQVGPPGDILLAGFVISGNAPKRVLIRGIGPALAAFGVSNFLPDPALNLYNSSNVRVAANDNWNGDALLMAAFAQVGAFELSGLSRDAALLITLQPGSYTAQVLAVNNTTGVGLVEVYEVPSVP